MSITDDDSAGCCIIAGSAILCINAGVLWGKLVGWSIFGGLLILVGSAHFIAGLIKEARKR